MLENKLKNIMEKFYENLKDQEMKEVQYRDNLIKVLYEERLIQNHSLGKLNDEDIEIYSVVSSEFDKKYKVQKIDGSNHSYKTISELSKTAQQDVRALQEFKRELSDYLKKKFNGKTIDEKEFESSAYKYVNKKIDQGIIKNDMGAYGIVFELKKEFKPAPYKKPETLADKIKTAIKHLT